MLKNSIQKKKTYRDLEIVNLFPCNIKRFSLFNWDVSFFALIVLNYLKLGMAMDYDGLFF